MLNTKVKGASPQVLLEALPKDKTQSVKISSHKYRDDRDIVADFVILIVVYLQDLEGTWHGHQTSIR